MKAKGFWRAYPPLKQHALSFVDCASPRLFRQQPLLAWGFYGHRLNLYLLALFSAFTSLYPCTIPPLPQENHQNQQPKTNNKNKQTKKNKKKTCTLPYTLTHTQTFHCLCQDDENCGRRVNKLLRKKKDACLLYH